MYDKWGVGREKNRGYLKIHVAVDIKTKEILALEVTDEKMPDGKVMKKLVKHILNGNHNEKVRSVLADGAYDSNENFKFLNDKGLNP